MRLGGPYLDKRNLDHHYLMTSDLDGLDSKCLSWLKQKRFLNNLEEELLKLTRLESVWTQLSIRSSTNGEFNNTALQNHRKVCNSLQGH